jgi:uncharacterized protein (TIGR00369 family)
VKERTFDTPLRHAYGPGRMASPASDEELRFPGSQCFGCSSTNPAALGLRFFRHDQEIYTRYSAPAHFCGAPGVLHGGILATIVDEVSCAVVAFLKGTHVVTGELSVRYLKPCPTGEEFEVRARIVDERPRYFVVDSEVSQGDTLLARSTGRFFAVKAAESAP